MSKMNEVNEMYYEYCLIITHNDKNYEFYGYTNTKGIKNTDLFTRMTGILEKIKTPYLKWIRNGRQDKIILYELMDSIEDWKTIIKSWVDWNEDYGGGEYPTISGYGWSLENQFRDCKINSLYLTNDTKELNKYVINSNKTELEKRIINHIENPLYSHYVRKNCERFSTYKLIIDINNRKKEILQERRKTIKYYNDNWDGFNDIPSYNE